MYITSITGVDYCGVMKNKNHSANVPEEFREGLTLDTTDIGKELVRATFDTQRSGKVAVELIPLENKGILSIYMDYFPGEEGAYSRQIDIDIESGDIVNNKINISEDFHSKFPFTNDKNK